MNWKAQKLNTERNSPLYRIFADHLRDAILAGELKAETCLPSSRDLQKQFNLSSITVEHGIKILVQEGFLIRRPRLGTFVAQPETRILPDIRKIRVKIIFSNIIAQGDYWFDILFSIEQRLKTLNAELLFERLDLSEPLPSCAEIIRNCDAVILCGTNPIELAESMLQRKFPFVMIGSPDRWTPALKKMDAYMGDTAALISFAIKTLSDMEHRKIAVICAPKGSAYEQDQRKGIMSAIGKYGLDEADIQIYSLPVASIETGSEVGCRILCQENRPTAVLAVDSMIALGFLHAAKQLGFRIPEDISLLCCDRSAILEFTDPPVTVVCGEQVKQAFIENMVKRLFDQMQDPKHKKSNLINSHHNIIFRESLIRNQQTKIIKYRRNKNERQK